MENDETTVETQDTEQEGQTETVEETGTEESTNESQSETAEETPEDMIVRLQGEKKHAENEAAKYRRLAEKGQKPKPQVKAPQTASSSVEETVLLAQGMPEELVTELKAVAAVRKVSLIKAQTDPIFVAVKEKFEKDKKQSDASMPASRTSGGIKPKKSLTTPNLSREDHMRLAKEAN